MAVSALALVACSSESGSSGRSRDVMGGSRGAGEAAASGEAGTDAGFGERDARAGDSRDHDDAGTDDATDDRDDDFDDDAADDDSTDDDPIVDDGPFDTVPSPCASGITPSDQIRRLRSSEYDHTLRDLLGVTSLEVANGAAPSTLLATDSDGPMTAIAWQGYQGAADAIAKQVMADPTLRANYLSCSLDEGLSCVRATVPEFGRRAFRRPLSAEELARFERVLDAGAQATATGSAAEVAELVLYTVLVSPSFLQHAELTEGQDGSGNLQLSQYELASRLSYLVWGSMPDAALSAAADNGELSSDARVLEHARRMLMDERARPQLALFHREYLEFERQWQGMNKDGARFPEFTRDTADTLLGETESLFDAVTFGQGTFADLFLWEDGFVNQHNAFIYGLDTSGLGTELTQVSLGPDRPGFLTRAGFLASHAGATRPSPTRRGWFIMKNVLGIDPGTPTSTPSTSPLPLDPGLSNRERVTAQTAAPDCAGCHELIDPPGFVLEAFDAIGAPQSVEADTNAPIDTVADVSIDGVPVTVRTPRDLMQLLAASKSAHRRYAERWLEFAYRRDATDLDECTLQALGALSHGGAPILEVAAGLTQSDAFTLRTQRGGTR